MRAYNTWIVLACLAGASNAVAQGGSCPLIVIDGAVQLPTVGPGETFGVTAYQCASCGFKREKDMPPEYSFSAEPIVLEVTQWSPLRPGDVIVAVNGHPITTRAGADQFTYPPEGYSALSVRRDGNRSEISWLPRRECKADDAVRVRDIERIEVLKGQAAVTQYGTAGAGGVIHIFRKPSAPNTRIIRPAPNVERPDTVKSSGAEGRFGFAVSCLPSCTKVRATDGTEYWKFDGHPPIAGIRAGGPAAMAGLQVGDIVAEIDGISILTEEGALRFQRAERKESIHLTVLRNGKQTGYLLKSR